MSTEYTYPDIPTEEEADTRVRQLESEGCTCVKSQQADGKWTVKAICPDS